MRSPLSDVYAKIATAFGVSGFLATVFFHPGMLCVTFIILVVTLSFYTGIEHSSIDRMKLGNEKGIRRRKCCNPPRRRRKC